MADNPFQDIKDEGVRNAAIRASTLHSLMNNPSGRTLQIIDSIIDTELLLERANDLATREALDIRQQGSVMTGAAENGVSASEFRKAVDLERIRRANPNQSARPTIQKGVPRMFVNTGGDRSLKDLVDIRPTMEKLGDDFPPPVQSELQRLP